MNAILRKVIAVQAEVETKADSEDVTEAIADIDLSTKQDVLVSGTNIKTVNSEPLLGSGNITVTGTTPTVATGAEVDTGTNNDKMVTPKAMEDSSYVKSTALHTQNTDAGTTGNTFTVDSDSTTGKIILDVALGSSNHALTLTNTALTANRTITFPNADGTVSFSTAPDNADNTATVIGEADAGEPSGSAEFPFVDSGTLMVITLDSLKTLLQQHFDTLYTPL